jgi:capsular exopolysaccharide synthesis family protein
MEQVSSNRLGGMDLDLRAYARTLYKRKWIIAAALLVSIGVGTFLTVRTTPLYTTRTTLFVGEQQFTIEEPLMQELAVRNLSVGLLKSYVEIVKSRTIAQKAIVDGGLDVPPQVVLGGLGASVIVDTQVIALTYTGADPASAARIANAVAEAFVDEIDRLAVPRSADDEPAVDVSIIDRAVTPTTPITPNTTRNIVLAVLIGLLGGVGLAFVIDQLDVTIKHRDDIEALGLQSLGSIPRLDTHGQEVYVERDSQGLGGEAFRKLRTSIGFINLESPTRTILVTSPVAQEGKTTTALNLAVAYALGGLRTVLVEADLRRPSLHRVFGMVGTNGLTTAIVGEVSLTDAIMQTDTRNLSVIVAGAIPPNPVELLGSDQMAGLLERLERMFDVVIVDSPPVAPVADPATLAARCGGVVLVVRAGKTDRRRIVDTARVLERAGGHLLGVVLNFQKPGDTPYEYEYYQGYRAAPSRAVAAGDQP